MGSQCCGSPGAGDRKAIDPRYRRILWGALIINALMFWAAASVLDGFHVAGFGAALLGSLIYSVLGLVIESALGGLFAKK